MGGRGGFVSREIWRDDGEGRAQLYCSGHRHRGMHTECPVLVAGRSNDSAPVRLTADGQRLTKQRRIVPLLNGRVERVHINVQDTAHRSVDPAHARAANPPSSVSSIGRCRSHSSVSLTVSSNGRNVSAFAMALSLRTSKMPLSASGIQSGNSLHGCTPRSKRYASSIHLKRASLPLTVRQTLQHTTERQSILCAGRIEDAGRPAPAHAHDPLRQIAGVDHPEHAARAGRARADRRRRPHASPNR